MAPGSGCLLVTHAPPWPWPWSGSLLCLPGVICSSSSLVGRLVMEAAFTCWLLTRPLSSEPAPWPNPAWIRSGFSVCISRVRPVSLPPQCG